MMNRRYLLAGIAAAALMLPLPVSAAMTHGTARPVISMAGLGVSTFSTTGSLSAGSPTLPVADASGFAINDHVVIEIGGESGAGAPGTTGVGGVWPDAFYDTVALMNDDTSKPDGQYAWVVANNNVYQSFSGIWSQNTSFYTKIVIPRSLAAKVIGKSGNTLTLDKNATVATTNANVYFDNAPIYNAIGINGSGTPDFRDIVWPAGKFYLSAGCFADQHNYWRFVGAGKDVTTLAFPKGISDLAVVWFEQCTAPIVQGITIQGNTKSSGYMIAWSQGDQTVAAYNFGIYMHGCVQPQVLQTKSIDCFQGVSCSFDIAPIVNSHDAVLTEGQYIEAWQIQGSDCTGGSIANCTITSPTWTGGYEWFRSTNCSFNNITSLNAFFAMNTADNWIANNVSLTMNGNGYTPLGVFAAASKFIVDINSNIGSAAVANGGKMTNVTITQNGLANPGTTNDTLLGIAVNVDNINVTLDGAVISLPNYTSPSTNHGAVGYVSDADNSTVKNYTCHGTVEAGWANLSFRGADSCYQNLTVDTQLGGAPC